MPKPELKDGLYAAYLRKSRADEDKERYGRFETLAVHERELTALAKREGYVIEEYFREIVSGERIHERHEFQRLMRLVEEGRYRGVLVYAIARLGRGDPMEYGWILFTLKRTRTLIITPTKVYDPTNVDDYRALQMEMFVSNMEFGNIVGRLVSGCWASAREGCFIKPTPPYGYDRARINGKWTLVKNDDAPTVKMIFERAAAGTPSGTIARDMNNAGMRTPCGGFWSASRLGTVIANPHYKGYIRYGYYHYEIVPESGFKTKRVRGKRTEYVFVRGLHEPIVSEEVWRAANDRNEGSAPVKRSYQLKNPLAGLLVCNKCGRAMVRFVNTCKSNGNKIPHYRHAIFCDCKARGANLQLVVDLLADALESIAADLEATVTVGDGNSTADELKSVETALGKEANRFEKLMELYFAEAISIDEFKARRCAAEERRKQLEARKAELLAEHVAPQELAVTVREAIWLLKDPGVPADEKNAALKGFIERIGYENHTPAGSRRNQDIRLYVDLRKL